MLSNVFEINYSKCSAILKCVYVKSRLNVYLDKNLDISKSFLLYLKMRSQSHRRKWLAQALAYIEPQIIGTTMILQSKLLSHELFMSRL